MVNIKSFKMRNYRYKIDKKNNKKHRCPACNKDKCFTRYIHKSTNEEAGDNYGICSRIQNCGYVRYPESTFDGNDYVDFIVNVSKKRQFKTERKYLNKEEYKSIVFKDWDYNNFCTFLHIKLGVKNAENVIREYVLGTGYDGATVYPYFDRNNNLVTYKTVHYKKLIGKRDHSRNSYYDKNPNKYDIPLFGSHLIDRYPELPIGIVEGEKTAVMMRCYNPYMVWLATGGVNMLNAKKIQPIKDREIYLFPDSGCFDGKASWYRKMEKIIEEMPLLNIDISTEVEIWQKDGFIELGDDIADYYNNAYRFCHQQQKMIRKEIEPIK
tara:strand:+ start:3859 stop:4830 length:972 start_codon:yes stop_codon:yes gene_type:complete